MLVSVIIVGIDQWEEYTKPFIRSLKEHEPEARIILIDNGSKDPYPYVPLHWRCEEAISYARAINVGLGSAPDSDWYIVANNDVLCDGPFIDKLAKLDKKVLYGKDLAGNDACSCYINGWIYFISNTVLSTLGRFDEKYKYAAYEDIDYSARATKKGIPIMTADLPFTHLQAGTRYTMPDYETVYEENRNYFKVKHGIS